MSLNSFRNGIGRMTEGPVGKVLLVVIGGALVFSLVYSGLGNNLSGGSRGVAPQAQNPDEVILTANGVDVPRADFLQTWERYQKQMQMMGQNPGLQETPRLHAGLIDNLTTQALLLAAAQKKGLTASSDDIQKARLELVQSQHVPEQLGLPATATAAEINAALAKKGQTMTLEQFFPDEQMRKQVLIRKLQESLMPPVTEQQARDFYKEYHTRHILIDNKKISDVQAQQRAKDILAKATQPGADFAALAKQYSDDPGTKSKGGDDGWISPATPYVAEFKTAAFALKPGQVTPDLVKTNEFGYFIIKLEGVKDNLPKDFDKNKAQYIAQVRQQMGGEAAQKYLQSVKTDPANKIVVKDPQLRADQALAQGMADPNKVKAAIADYQTALKDAAPAQKAEIQAGLAQAYQQSGDLPHAITALQAAADASHDTQTYLKLGQLYQQSNQPDKAVAVYQQASSQAWNDPSVHLQIKMAYTALKRPDLAAKEDAWIRDYQKAHPPTPNNGAFGGGPISISPSGPSHP